MIGELIVFGIIALVILLSHLSLDRPALRKLLYALMVFATVAEITVGLMLLFGVFTWDGSHLKVTREQSEVIIGALVLGPLASLVFFRRGVRAWLPTANYDPDRMTHIVGTWIFFQLICYMLVVSSTGIWSQNVKAADPKTMLQELGLTSLWYIMAQKLMEMVLAFIGVGVFFKITLKDAFVRLGLKMVDMRDIYVAVSTLFFIILLQMLVGAFIFSLQPDYATDEARFSQAISNLPIFINTFVTASIFGIFTGLGEELLFRGWIQPVAGIPLTSLLFALFHYQYGIGIGLLQVLVLSLILGLVRRFYGTTVSAMIHAAYNTFAMSIILNMA